MVRRRDMLRLITGASARVAIAGSPLEWRVAAISRRTVRIVLAAPRVPVPNPGTLVPAGVAAASEQVLDAAAAHRIALGALEISVKPDALKVTGAPSLAIDPATGTVSFGTSDGPILGLGEGGPQFDRRGSFQDMRNGQIGHDQRTFGARIPVPFVIGTAGWAIYFHHPGGKFDFSNRESARFLGSTGAAEQPLVLFVIVSSEPAGILQEYATLTGLPEMPPLWSFGYHQSHRTLAGRDEVMAVARTFREKKLPCDSLIYLGTGFCPAGWNTGHGSFTFNPATFPDPAAMIRQLHDEHFHVSLHVVYRNRVLEGSVHDPCATPGNVEGAGCYWRMHRDVERLGIDGWWPDEGDPLDVSSRLARDRLYYDGPLMDRPNIRPFALHRNGVPGTQRFGAFVWSGDINSTWETLRLQVPVAINTGLSGLPYWGTDTGGFVPTKELTGELYARWFAFSAFCPLFRSHGRTWKLRLPWQWNTGELGPSETSGAGSADPDPSELHNAAVEPICRKYLELRYRMLPYIYSMVRESCETGLPLMRALWLHHPDDPAAVACGDQYLWGRDILVAPVVERGATERKLYLPRGVWHDFWNDSTQEGGREITRDADLATIPLFVRAGAILPFGPLRQYTGERVEGAIQLAVYPGADGRFVLYDDDGISYNFRRGYFTRILCEWRDRARELTLTVEHGRERGIPEFEIRAVPDAKTHRMRLRGRRMTIKL
jgi:alpha-glucosidase/alpha-D-xyloside xylohydrolase